MGSRCVKKFNGMCHLRLDKESQIVFLSRDRFGIKPLYYFVNATKFIFGSEIKQLLINRKKLP